MPLFEYKCRDCGHQFEKLVRSMSDEASVACPKCGTEETDKQFSTFAVGSSSRSQSEPAAPSCNRCGEDRPPCMQ